MKCQVALALIALLWAAQPLPAHAQAADTSTEPPTAAPLTTLTARSTLVLVPALVRNKAKQLVFTLKADDFVLTDDGVPQKLKLEEDTGGEPLALVVVLEGGGAGAHELDKYDALVSMIGSVVGNVPHKVAVVGFDSSPVLVQDFSPDIATTEHAIQALITDDSGDKGAAILDSIGFAVDLLRKQPTTYRRAILLVSETIDRGSHSHLDEALRSISDTNTAIYSIGFSSGRDDAAQEASKFSSREPGPAHGCMSRDPNDPQVDLNKNPVDQAYDCLSQLVPPLRLVKMAVVALLDGLHKNIPETVAHLTGGEYFKLTSEKSLERDLATISNHIPNRYVLSFQPQSPHPGLHFITLRLPNYINLEVTARNSYWADGEAAAQK